MKTKNEIHFYWKNPNDGVNSPESYLSKRANQRTKSLVNLVKYLPIHKKDKILELGCNVGRNLEALRRANYTNTFGIDINVKAIDLGEKCFPELRGLYYGSIEEWIIELKDNDFELVFTMAVLEHIHPSSEWIFKEIARITKYLITIEDEHSESWRHFPRNYKEIFVGLGMAQIKMTKIKGLSNAFVGRVFKNES